jgi:hypothetical protein
MSTYSRGRRCGAFQQPRRPASSRLRALAGPARQSYVPTIHNDVGRRWSCWIFSHQIMAFAAQGSTIIDDDGLRVFAGPFESEATAIAWIIQRQETMNLRRSERAAAIH